MTRPRYATLLTLLAIAAPTIGHAQDGRLIVHVDKPGHRISPTFYGLMTEEINHSYDGGLYAELIRNRSFQDSATEPAHWSVVARGGAGTVALDRAQPLNAARPVSLRLDVTSVASSGGVGAANDGFWGVPVRPDTRYRATVWARASEGYRGPLDLDIESADGGTVFARASIPRLSAGWRKYTATLHTGRVAPSADNRFVLSMRSPGTVWLGYVSLYPPTYRDTPNGNRTDLMQLLGGMKPSFLRLPGGNYLEGNTISERFDWKRTIGNVVNRPGHQCPWGYRSSDGLGLLEYLEWCEDLHMEPVLAVFAGYALNGEHVAAGPGLDPFVQDALDEIEYVAGGPETRWGAERVKDGHPAPFPLHYVEIGNEDAFDRSRSYDGRYAQFFDAIKARYPALQVIATTPVRTRRPDMVDDHYYRSARQMEADVHHYDAYDRSGPKVFVGEWASTEGSPTPTLQAALGDAAWLTGLERNSDLVLLEAYAPLLVNVNPGARQWGTNLVGYDALSSFGSPSYYVQSMFGNNRGDLVLPLDVDAHAPAPPDPPMPRGAVGVGTWETQAEYRDVEVTQGDRVLYKWNGLTRDGNPPPPPAEAGWRTMNGTWTIQDGALRQTSGRTDCRAVAGDRDWTDYTLRLKARKIGGREGFLILFHARDRGDYLWWNLGGWGDTRTAIEQVTDGAHHEIGRPSDATIETGRWYDVRIEVRGRSIRCYLDDRLVTEATDTPAPPVEPVYATASRDDATGDVIVKVVNVSAMPQSLSVQLAGAASVAPSASAEVLSGQPADVNSVEDPLRVAPRREHIAVPGSTFSHVFPAYSVTVLRVRAR